MPTTPITPLLKHQIVASLGEFGDFDRYAGGNFNLSTVDYIPAGRKTPLKLQGTNVHTDITVSRAYNHGRDAKLVDWYKRASNGIDSDRVLTVRYKDQAGRVVGEQSFPVKPMNLDYPDGVSGDNSPAEISLTLAVENAA